MAPPTQTSSPSPTTKHHSINLDPKTLLSVEKEPPVEALKPSPPKKKYPHEDIFTREFETVLFNEALTQTQAAKHALCEKESKHIESLRASVPQVGCLREGVFVKESKSNGSAKSFVPRVQCFSDDTFTEKSGTLFSDETLAEAQAVEPASKPSSPQAKYLHEGTFTQECKTLLPTLPKDKGWVCTHLFQYQGFWHTTRQLQGVIASQAHFVALPSDTLLITTPKSGTTWLKALLFALTNRHNHPAAAPNHPLTAHNPHDLVPFLELKLYADNRLPNLSDTPSPRLFASHLPVTSLPSSVWSSGSKIIYLCRNPKDTFISLWHFTNRLRLPSDGPLPLEEALERFCRGVSLYGPFWDHVLGYWLESREQPHKVLFMKYEDLKADPVGSVKRLAGFLECPFSDEEGKDGAVESILGLCSFDSLSNLEVNKSGKLDSGEEKKAFFRRGEVGDWKNYLTPEMIEKMDRISEEKLEGSGLEL